MDDRILSPSLGGFDDGNNGMDISFLKWVFALEKVLTQ